MRKSCNNLLQNEVYVSANKLVSDGKFFLDSDHMMGLRCVGKIDFKRHNVYLTPSTSVLECDSCANVRSFLRSILLQPNVRSRAWSKIIPIEFPPRYFLYMIHFFSALVRFQEAMLLISFCKKNSE